MRSKQETARAEAVPTPAARQDPAVRAAVEKARADRAQARARASAETNRALADRNVSRDRTRDAEIARKLDNDDDAKTLVYSILGGAAAGAIAGNLVSRDSDPRYRDGRYHRLPPEQVGRGPRDREQSVDFLSRRFRGGAAWDEAPASWHRHSSYEGSGYVHQPYYFNGNRRVVYYQSYQNIPPILLASQRLTLIEVATLADSPYRLDASEPAYYENLPEAYRQDDSYAVSYEVDPESAVILDDILFEQGSTAFSDAYSYDLVADLADAMNSTDVVDERFVIEGHASAEGDYNANHSLSQERAERIARDLVDMGVSPDRLVPVGYGETEARFPDGSIEEERSLDRRVMIFRMNE